MFRAWEIATAAATPLAPALLRLRARRGRETPARFAERLGHASLARPPGRLVWLHAASVGETQGLLPLLGALRGRAVARLLTSGTLTGAAAAGADDAVLRQLAPFDLPGALARFLDHWRPDLAVLAESELWPGRLAALARRGVPVIVVNGRMSARSARRWSLVPAAARALLGRVALVLAQSEADAAHYRRLGARQVETVGNLKHAAPPLPVDPAALAELRGALAGRPVWVTASTHAGEEAIVARAAAEARSADLLTIVVPRHPERGGEVARVMAEHGLAPARRSATRLPGADTRAFIADTLGELGLWYRLAAVAFVGGSLVPIGGHNPLEPARLGCPVLVGPHTGNVAPLLAPLLAAGGARQVRDGGELGEALAMLLADAPQRASMAAAAQVLAGHADALPERVIARLARWLDDGA